jgi:hypothetical protein
VTISRALARRGGGGVDEQRYSADTWLSDYLMPSTFSYGGTTYQTGGLNQSLVGARVQEIAHTLPGYMAALRGCPPAFAAQMVRALVLSADAVHLAQPAARHAPQGVRQPRARLLEQPWPKATTGDVVATMEWHAGLAGNAFVARPPGPAAGAAPGLVRADLRLRAGPGEIAATALDGELLGLVYQNGGIGSGRGADVTRCCRTSVAHWSQIPDPECPGIGHVVDDRRRCRHAGRPGRDRAQAEVLHQRRHPEPGGQGHPGGDEGAVRQIVEMMESKHAGPRTPTRRCT